MHSTNYFNTLIEIAEDCPIQYGEVPPVKGEKRSVANLQFDMLYDHPYQYTSDEILFAVFATRKEIARADREQERQRYFSKGQPCFRASPLTKRYGWGIHANAEGKLAMISSDSATYRQLLEDTSVTKKKAMRSRRK